MVRNLIHWAIYNPLVVLLLTAALVGFGGYAFTHVNVEAYPDPAPAIIEVVAQYPGASAEEVERQVTIPLEIALAGMPHLKYTRSKSLFGLAHIRNQFDYGYDYQQAKQEVINRLQDAKSQLPASVTPQISPTSPTGEIFRYTLRNPKDPLGREIYTLNDLKALQDWVLVREFQRIPRIAGVGNYGGTVKRYEIHPDPERLQQYGITLQQLQNAVAASNANVGGDYLPQGPTVKVVRGLGLIGQGQDPMQHIMGLTDPSAAGRLLREEEERRCHEIRKIVLASTNNVPVRVEDVVYGGPLRGVGQLEARDRGVVVGYQTRQGRIGMSRPVYDAKGQMARDRDGRTVWVDEDEKVMGIVLLRKGEDSLPALHDVKSRVKELNEMPGRLPPGVKIEPYYDREDLINITTETVRENLAVGILLVGVILLMFLSNIRSAVIVAINIPLALLFAFAVLFLRGKSANLLSIGAVDFGIIVDSSVIMVENIYRHLRINDEAATPLRERIYRAGCEMERSLFFSTIIMVCALLPLFTMQGPEGQIFGPMADTYAFALGGALLLAVTVSPVLCLLAFDTQWLRHNAVGIAVCTVAAVFLAGFGAWHYQNWLAGYAEGVVQWMVGHATWVLVGLLVAFGLFLLWWESVKTGKENLLVRSVVRGTLWSLDVCLRHRVVYLTALGGLVFLTATALPFLGQEFMPTLEEGNCYIRGTFPIHISLDEVAAKVRIARSIMHGPNYPEVEAVVSLVGRPDDGTDPTGFYNAEFFVPLKRPDEWPVPPGHDRPRKKAELVEEMHAELSRVVIGIDWDFSQNIRDNVMESLSGVKGENSVKIFGPDLERLELVAEQVKNALAGVRGVEDAGVFRIRGQSNLEFPIDRDKCARWNINVADVQNVIQTAVGGQAFTQVIEGEKRFDLTLRWPQKLRENETQILSIPVDIIGHTVTQGSSGSLPPTPLTGSSVGLSFLGSSLPMPALTGGMFNAVGNYLAATPRRRLRDLVTPLGSDGRPDSAGSFVKSGASTIYREQGNRLIAVKFGVRGRDLASAVAEAQTKVKSLIPPGYRVEWSGEFQEMEEAEQRLILIVSLALILILVLLYLAFGSLIDALVVLSNVVAVSLGGIWALLVTHTNFNISAAVGFISILGVAIMNGLLLVSSFNALRAKGLPLSEALTEGTAKLARPIIMTAMAAIFGMLPAAFSTRIGSQSQQPLAIAVVGGMLMSLLLTQLVPVLYSFYGHREPPAGAGNLAH